MWQCRCATDNLHPAEVRLCERCNTVAPPDLVPAPQLDADRTGRLLGLVTWLDGYIAARGAELDPMVAQGISLVLHGARANPPRTYKQITDAADVVAAVRGWVDSGIEPDRTVFDRLLTRTP